MRLTDYVISRYLKEQLKMPDQPYSVIKGQAVNMARVVRNLHQRIKDLEEEAGID